MPTASAELPQHKDQFFGLGDIHCLWIFQHFGRLHRSILKYLAAGGPSVTVFSRCLNKKMPKDVSDSQRNNGCYRYSKTDAPPDRCQWGHLQVLGSGAADRCVINITTLLLLIRASLIPGTHPPVSLIPLSFHSISCNCRRRIIRLDEWPQCSFLFGGFLCRNRMFVKNTQHETVRIS